MRHILVTIIFLALSHEAICQLGGSGTYNFLNLTALPRTAALGGKVAALDESDAGVTFNNPAHLTSDLHNRVSLSYINYFDKIQYGFLSYSRSLSKYGNVGLGLQHVSYGNFIAADETGMITGSFTSYEMAVSMMYSYTFDSLFTFGVALKPVYSQLEQYNSFGVCADVGVSYSNPEHLFSAAIAARNIGSMIKPYTPNTFEPMPFEIIAGFSKKLRHAPFRFVVTMHQLQNLNMFYERERESSTFFGDDTGNSKTKLEKYGTEFMSHIILGVEFIPLKNFYLRGGYNYQRRNELKIEDRAGMVGFSWGLGIKIERIYISYSWASYHIVGGSNHFSISTDLDDFFNKKKL